MRNIQMICNRVREFYGQLSHVCRRCGRDPKAIQVLFATKYLSQEEFPLFVSRMLADRPGRVLIGENRVQAAEEKFASLDSFSSEQLQRIEKIFIGTLQKNKIDQAIELFNAVHSVDSLDLAILLDRQMEKKGERLSIFLQMNISGEVQKHGIAPQEIDHITSKIAKMNHVDLQGFMTMAPLVGNPEAVRPIFKTLRQLADRYGLYTSMGMSNDWKVAVEEGSDIVRIGSAIFS